MAKQDPRITALKKGQKAAANVVLQDRAIRHAIFLTRYTTQEVEDIIRLLNKEVVPDLLRQITLRTEKIKGGQALSKAATQRLKDLAIISNEIVRSGFSEARSLLTQDMKDFSRAEAVWQVSAMESSVPFNFDFKMPAPGLLRAVVTSKPMQGRLLRKWFNDQASKTQRDLMTQLRIGILEGESTSELVARVRGTRANNFKDGVLSKNRAQTEAIVRTAVTHVSNFAREEVYKENDDVVKGVKYISTLDARTTDICRSLDGEVFDVGKGPRPPQHHQCRSTTTPILEGFEQFGLKDPSPSTRASMDGQVPETLNYNQWLKGTSRKNQIAALGPTRADLLRKGKINPESFSDKKGNRLTLKQLKRKEGITAKDVTVKKTSEVKK